MLPGFKFFNQDGEELRERVSQFLSPAILQAGLGFYYKKNQDLWVNMSPVSARMIIVSKKFTQELEVESKYFGVDFNKRSKFFFGALKKRKTLILIGILILGLRSIVKSLEILFYTFFTTTI